MLTSAGHRVNASFQTKGGLTMKGNIYTTKSGYLVWYPMGKERDIRKRFIKYDDAEKFLVGLNFKDTEGTLDGRDYRADNPLGFSNLVDRFLYSKRLLKDPNAYVKRIRFAVNAWDNRNIKTIGYADIEALMLDLQEKGYASRYRHEICRTIKHFFNWLVQSKEIKHDEMPGFPEIKYSSPYRTIIDKKTQLHILRMVQTITKFNPRIYIGILFLSTYINARPGELLHIKEKDIDLENGRILIRHSKTRDEKFIFLLPDDIELLKQQPRGFPELYFFRHIKGRHGVKAGDPFAKNYFYRWWRKACDNLGIKGVDLYGGTRHSSMVDLRQYNTPEEIKRGSGHKGKSSFDRYLQIHGDELRRLYAQTRGDVVELKEIKNGS